MPVTRSSTRSASGVAAIAKIASPPPVAEKRKLSQTKDSRKRPKTTFSPATATATRPALNQDSSTTVAASDSDQSPQLVPAVLTFSFDEGKKHLISVDPRFEDLFSKMKCKPFEHLEQVHPFRALVTSILGQQISWMAARSINHRFIRLYDPSLPEKATDNDKYSTDFFPSPAQVSNTNIETLRTAGLSARKAEYVRDLAARFADGRLSTESLISATDEELADMLIEVRGIGRWTVDMFAIFSLRRPDILPVGDLGVQRGMVIWFMSMHSPSYDYAISPEKVGGKATKKAQGSSKKSAKKDMVSEGVEESSMGEGNAEFGNLASPDISSALPESSAEQGIVALPPPFTPSVKKALYEKTVDDGFNVAPLPEGLSVSVLKSRLDGKKIKGAFLTPKEMNDLTATWKPYRSLGVYYMWSLASMQ